MENINKKISPWVDICDDTLETSIVSHFPHLLFFAGIPFDLSGRRSRDAFSRRLHVGLLISFSRSSTSDRLNVIWLKVKIRTLTPPYACLSIRILYLVTFHRKSCRVITVDKRRLDINTNERERKMRKWTLSLSSSSSPLLLLKTTGRRVWCRRP